MLLCQHHIDPRTKTGQYLVSTDQLPRLRKQMARSLAPVGVNVSQPDKLARSSITIARWQPVGVAASQTGKLARSSETIVGTIPVRVLQTQSGQYQTAWAGSGFETGTR